MKTTSDLIVAISGASGAIYGIRMLEVLRQHPVKTHLVVSPAASITLQDEMGYSLSQAQELADYSYSAKDIAAPIASGSFKVMGMVIAPCSMRTLAEIANGMSSSLISRAADVVLKERRKLVLMARETPLTSIHLQNMQAVTQAGGIISPPVPAFYHHPKDLDEMINQTVGRVLDLFDIDVDVVERWQGLKRNKKA